MSFMLVTVAFLSFSSVQGDQSGPTGRGATIATENRDQPEVADNGEGTEANGERRICRRIPTSRTHMYRRVCLTARQWRDYDED